MFNGNRSIGGVDVVVPFYNEQSVLPGLCRQLAAQVDDQGRALPAGFFRVIAANNASTDGSVELLQSFQEQPPDFQIVVIDEPEKGVVQARKTGSEYAVQDSDKYPWLLHIDADNDLPPTLVYDVAKRLSSGQADVLAYAGHFSREFWRRVPNLAQHYYESVGTLEFCQQTLADFGFEQAGALFTPQLFDDFVRVPNQLGLAMSKQTFRQCGGYFREYDADGNEILGEARNIWFRLDRQGARLQYVSEPMITLNPRRLLGDPVGWCGGRSYAGGMSDIRHGISPDSYLLLNRLAANVDFSMVRRNLVKRFIIEPCVAVPGRMDSSPAYFDGFQRGFKSQINQYFDSHHVARYADVLPLVLKLTESYTAGILENIHNIRGL